MLIDLSDVSCYPEREISREKEIKKLLQLLASIFIIDLVFLLLIFVTDLKKKPNITSPYGRFQRFKCTYRSWEDKCRCCQMLVRCLDT